MSSLHTSENNNNTKSSCGGGGWWWVGGRPNLVISFFELINKNKIGSLITLIFFIYVGDPKILKLQTNSCIF